MQLKLHLAADFIKHAYFIHKHELSEKLVLVVQYTFGMDSGV